MTNLHMVWCCRTIDTLPAIVKKKTKKGDAVKAKARSRTLEKTIAQAQSVKGRCCYQLVPCCDRGGEYNGFGSDGPLKFVCIAYCRCHD